MSISLKWDFFCRLFLFGIFLWFGCFHDFADAFLMAADIMVEIKMPFLTKLWCSCLNVSHKMMAIGLVLVSRFKEVSCILFIGIGSDGSEIG